MSAILDALVKLENSIGKLEGAANDVEATVQKKVAAASTQAQFQQGQQPDMFGGASASAVAKKLDTIIESAETVLRESRG